MLEKEKIRLDKNQSLVLNEYDRFWMITSGEVNVFYVEIDSNGQYTSTLNFLYTVESGELLFSLMTSKEKEKDYRLVIVSKGASLIAINKNKLFDIDRSYLKGMIDKWIIKTTNQFQNIHIPRKYTSLENMESISLEEGELAYPTHGIVWCELIKGKFSVYSASNVLSPNLEFNFPIVASSTLWIKAVTNGTEIKIFDTKQILRDEINFMLSFNSLQDFIYNKIVEEKELEIQNEKKRILKKVTSEGDNLSSTLDRLRLIVMGDKNQKIRTLNNNSKLDNYLFATCQLIGDATGYEFKVPKFMESFNTSTSNQLYAIAQSSKVRLRKVIFRGDWWKEESGHLLAFYKKDKRPVALIQSSPSSYLLKDVSTGINHKVNSEIADQLEPIGYMFFYGFNNAMDSIKKIGEFAIQGVKKDAKYLILAAFAGSLIGLLVPVLTGIMFDDVIPAADKSLHVEVFVILLMIGLVSAGLQLIQGVLQLRVETKSSIDLQAGVMDHLLRLPVTFYRKYSSGDLTNRALSINAIRQILSSTVLTAVLSGAFSFVNLGLLFYYESSLAWIGIALAVLAVIFMTAIGFTKLKYDREVSDIQGDLQGFLFEFLSGITKIRISGGERRIFTMWAAKFSRLKQLGFRSGSQQNFVEIFNSSYPLFTSIFFFGFIYYSFNNAESAAEMISVGAFVAFIAAFNQFLRECLKMSMALITSLNVITLYERVSPILSAIPESSGESTDPGELEGNIEMNSVNFKYDEDQPLVLKNLSFKIKQGEMVAFVGTSGSGKSTIMRLLLGFEHPETGSIYYDGDSFDSMNKDLVRRQVGVVLQNGALMSGSIFKNIVGNSELTLEDAWTAARMAGMEEDIKQMPMEMHTMVSEGAGTFSGGQRQRLMIARAIVHKPRILFMDEATSALDNKTQTIVAESLDKLKATRIVIAHRLSTVKNADCIYVLDKGTIIESGSYADLIEKDGIFSNLAKRQTA
jgi:ATP-binding cassette subfamily C protein